MSHGTYVNLEIITLEIIEEQIKLMTENNGDKLVEGEPEYDLDKLLINYKRGYIVVTMLVSLVESFLNDILSQYIVYESDIFSSETLTQYAECVGDEILKSRIDKKIDILYSLQNKDSRDLRGNHLYGRFKEVNKIRNELIHYKGNYIGNSFTIMSIKIGRYDLGEIFIKHTMELYLEDIKKLIDLIAGDLDLLINYKAHPIASDGYDDNYRFAIIKETIY